MHYTITDIQAKLELNRPIRYFHEKKLFPQTTYRVTDRQTSRTTTIGSFFRKRKKIIKNEPKYIEEASGPLSLGIFCIHPYMGNNLQKGKPCPACDIFTGITLSDMLCRYVLNITLPFENIHALLSYLSICLYLCLLFVEKILFAVTG